MKQNITLKQWNELSDEKKKILIAIVYSNDNVEAFIEYLKTLLDDKMATLPNIGELIGYLGDDWLFQLKNAVDGEDSNYGIEAVEGLLEPRFILDNCWEATKHKLKV